MELGTAVAIVCIVLLSVAVIAGLLYWHSHKASEAATFTKLDSIATAAEAHSTALASLGTTLAGHGVTISALQTGVDHIEDKVSNAVTGVEASTAAKDLEAAYAKGKVALDALAAAVAGAAAVKAALTPPAGGAAAAGAAGT